MIDDYFRTPQLRRCLGLSRAGPDDARGDEGTTGVEVRHSIAVSSCIFSNITFPKSPVVIVAVPSRVANDTIKPVAAMWPSRSLAAGGSVFLIAKPTAAGINAMDPTTREMPIVFYVWKAAIFR